MQFQLRKYPFSPIRVRPGSPPPGASTFTTSAPSQARHWVQEGPASYWVKSKMRKPFSAVMVQTSLNRKS